MTFRFVGAVAGTCGRDAGLMIGRWCMVRLNRVWLVLLVTLALVASGVTVAMADELTQEIPKILGFGDGDEDVPDEPAESAEEEPADPADAVEGDEADSGEDVPEDVAADADLVGEGELYSLQMDGFVVEVDPDGMMIRFERDGEMVEVPVDRMNNHGAFVSAVAKAVKGAGHGALVRQFAQSALGKDGYLGELVVEDTESPDEPVDLDVDEDAGADAELQVAASNSRGGGKVHGKAAKSKKAGKKSGKR
jgi:hypothetical protein